MKNQLRTQTNELNKKTINYGRVYKNITRFCRVGIDWSRVILCNILFNFKFLTMKTKQQKPENPQLQQMRLFDCINWWKNQSFAGDKGGSFNLKLYFDYLSKLRP